MNLLQYAGLWTLVSHPSRTREWSLKRKIEAIKSAGFAGVRARLDVAIASVAQEHGLFMVGLIFPTQEDEIVPLLRAQRECGAEHVEVQLALEASSPADAARTWLRVEKEAEKLGLSVSLETHRDTIADSPERIHALAERYQKLTGRVLALSWDFSHLALVKHLHAGNLAERLLSRPELIQCARHFHFRPFNGHHAQLPITHKRQLTPEVRDYLGFVKQVLAVWKAAPENRDATLHACPDLGPVGGYALTGFPPVWPDAIVLSRELSKLWKTT